MPTAATHRTRPSRRPVAVVKRRPAEAATGVAGVVAYFIARAFDLNGQDVAMLTVLVGFVPTAVTWVVNLIQNRG